MKQNEERPYYSAQEILQIMDRAKATGVTTINVPGFEATLVIGHTPTVYGPTLVQEPPNESATFVIPIGKYKGRLMREIPKSDMGRYCAFLLEDSDNGKTLSDAAKTLIDKAELFHFGKISWRKS